MGMGSATGTAQLMGGRVRAGPTAIGEGATREHRGLRPIIAEGRQERQVEGLEEQEDSRSIRRRSRVRHDYSSGRRWRRRPPGVSRSR